MRIIPILFVAIFTLQSFAQELYFTRDGLVTFFSSTPVEDIEAVNNKLTAVLNAENGQVEFSALIKSFEFEKALMQEHFNENYMESNEFPKATFKGEIVDFSAQDLSSKEKVVVKGTMTIHGVSKEIEETGTIVQDGQGNYHIKATFKVNPEDYEIEIPNTVREKIAKEIDVTVDATLAPRK